MAALLKRVPRVPAGCLALDQFGDLDRYFEGVGADQPCPDSCSRM